MIKFMKKIIEKAKQILHDADSGSDECKHYNNGFLDGIKFAEMELKNCNLQNVSQQRELLANYSEWLSHRNLNDDTMNPEDWADVYLANCG